MAAVIVVLGSMLGLVVGLVGWVAFDLSLVAALAIWIGAGPLSVALAALIALIPHDRHVPAAADPVLVKV